MTDTPSLAIAEVVHAGISTTLQDLGRAGAKKFGVPLGGVMDRTSMLLANQLFDNSANAPVYEILGGIKLRCLQDSWFCVTGTGTATLAGESVKFHRTIAWRQGVELVITADARGLWTYLAIPGGWYGEKFLGSSSVWPTAGMGEKLRVGDRIFSQTATTDAFPPAIKSRFTRPDCIPSFAEKNQIVPIRAWAGPQYMNFAESCLQRFWQCTWTISLQSSRAGYRLEGEALTTPTAMMLSEATILGSIQVPPSGQPIILLNDGPTIGGYHKIALVHPHDLDALRQLPPLSRLQFIPCE